MKTEEILTASQHFSQTVIKPIQKKMLAVFDKLIYFYGYETELYIEPLNLFNEDGVEVGEAEITAQE